MNKETLIKKDVVQLKFPIIDLQGIENGGDDDGARRKEVVDEIRKASETWGFFQLINHGIPRKAIDELLNRTRRFHEQPKEAKMDLYSADAQQNVRLFTTQVNLKENRVIDWKDALALSILDDSVDFESFPLICRNEVVEYLKHMLNLRDLLSELLSEALGLNSDHLASMECMKGKHLLCQLYPPFPEPDITLGAVKHTDPTFLTVVAQDSMGGLKVLYQDQWVDVPSVPGALVVNIGDLMQLITNDKFRSAEHGVLVRSTGSRVSIVCFFFPRSSHTLKPYGPIKELLSEKNPPLYREVNNLEYTTTYAKLVKDQNVSVLSQFRL